jgi:hypothetical protein
MPASRSASPPPRLGVEELHVTHSGVDRFALLQTSVPAHARRTRSTRACSCWEVCRLLEPHVDRVVVVSPDDTGISSAHVKTDKLDARTLAWVIPSSQIATTQNSRCTSRPIARPTQPASPSLTSTRHVHVTGEPAGRRHRPIRALNVAQSRQVAGAAERKAQARSPSIKTAYPSAFSHARPLSRTNRSCDRDRTDLTNAVHASRTGRTR